MTLAPSSSTAGPDELRRMFRRHAAAVAVITASHRAQPVGLLATSLTSLSAEPPLVSFNVARSSSSWPAIATAEHLGIHVLQSDQEDLAARFARRGADRFSAPTSWRRGQFDVPLLDGVAAWAVTEVAHRFDTGDHVIVVARLLHAATREGAGPLLHHDGAWVRVGA